jgi:xylulokinase
MTMKELLLGIDFGTGGCKATLADCSGHVLAEASGEYSSSHPRPGWAEQNPADWFDTMCSVLRKMNPAQHGRVIAVGLDGYTHGAVLLDKSNKVIRPTIIWTDQRSIEECRLLKERHFDLIFSTGFQAPTPTWTLPQLLWLKNNEADNFARIERILFTKDYVRYLLTGVMGTDFIEAQGALLWDMRKSRWSEELCSLAGLPMKTLPAIGRPTEIAGRITKDAAEATGLPEGAQVIFGASDSAVEDYAAGAIEPGQCILKLATAGNVNVMTAEAHPHPETLTYSHVVPGLWYTVSATNAAAVCQRWFRDQFCGDLALQAKAEGVSVYKLIEFEASKSQPGANGVMFHPYLMGERSPYWDPFLRGSFTGISMGSSRGDLSRALLEGVAFSLRDCFRSIERMGLEAREFILIGGGAKSSLWSRIVCDVFNAPVRRPESCDASFGSALLAGVGAKVFSDEVSAVKGCVKFQEPLAPEKSGAELYAKRFSHYLKIHDALAGIYREMAN